MSHAVEPRPSSTGILKFCAALGPLFTLMWLGGAGPASGFTFILPPSAANSSAETLASYLEHLTAIRVGCVLMIFSACLYTCWNIAISNLARRLEGPRPILFHIQVISVAACVVVVMFIGFFWGVAAFRAGQTSPEITQALNDLGWFGVLFTGAPFAVYQIALGAAIIRSDGNVFPRWSAYLNFFVSVFMVEASLILFFKTGAFSQNGLAVFYLPMISFFVWICTMSWLTYRAADAEQRAERAAAAVDVAPEAATEPRVRVGA
jgi:hypothetical protein